MDAAEFQDWLSGIGSLSLAQLRQAFGELALFESSRTFDGDACTFPEASATGAVPGRSPAVPEAAAAAKPVSADSSAGTLHRRVESVGCPHCQGHETVRWGSASALPRYRCKSCGRTFNALTKTPLARLRNKNKWQEHSRAMIDGVSIAKTADRCGVHYTTAFRWRHRFLGSQAYDKPKALLEIVASEETFILESYRGKRSDMPCAPRRRGGKAAKRGLSAEQIPMGLTATEEELTKRVSRFVKAELKQADVTYAEFAKQLKEHGFPKETESSIKSKLARGTFTATFLLATLAALKLEVFKLKDI
jgi:transposase-like protein